MEIFCYGDWSHIRVQPHIKCYLGAAKTVVTGGKKCDISAQEQKIPLRQSQQPELRPVVTCACWGLELAPQSLHMAVVESCSNPHDPHEHEKMVMLLSQRSIISLQNNNRYQLLYIFGFTKIISMHINHQKKNILKK